MVDDQRPADADRAERCPVCDGQPRVLVAMRHPSMLRFTRELLERECGCWVATESRTDRALAHTIEQFDPDLVVIDVAGIAASCVTALAHVRRDRVIVIGPEPDPAYRAAALRSGADAWLSRDEVADRLGCEMRRVLGCRHDPCPPGEPLRQRLAGPRPTVQATFGPPTGRTSGRDGDPRLGAGVADGGHDGQASTAS